MGILDFLSDLAKASQKDELGLGGRSSLLGTRGAAPIGADGDMMMKRTSGDSLPGYFDPTTREYVPWYVDLFDGGGLNKAGGEQAAAEQPNGVMSVAAGGPDIAAKELMRGGNIELSDMERLNRMPGVDPRNLGGAEGYGPMGVDPRNLGGASGYGQTGVAPSGTIVPLDEILTPEEIARRDAEAKMAQIQSGNFTFADLIRMASSGRLAQSNRQRLNQ
tara:strand:- start:1107 stop:1763 length:657 start_codon:yes stop_codon:yes gene_type:complete